MKKAKGRGPSKNRDVSADGPGPFLVRINVYPMLTGVYIVCIMVTEGTRGKHAQPGRPEAVTERRLV